jgi:hypothetical protein
MDREAYDERLAIMQVEAGEGDNLMHLRQVAADAAYHTRFALAATEGANGNWDAAKEWCCELRERFGDQMARDLMRDLQQAVKDEMKRRA